MEYRASTEEQHFREEVREWLHANKPREARPKADYAAQRAYDSAWKRAQFDGGWAGIAWPKAYGGRGLTPVQQLIWCEEYLSGHCPPVHDCFWLAENHAGPTLIARGTEAQKSFHLPRILKGEAPWCQGFSEPNAGSDLASLRTRAEIDGDHLVVNGQKIWTTNAHLCDYQELLVRTGAPDGRHRGLTWVICDMRTPGIDVRPIKALDGRYHNCEVFYDDVRIPLSNVVGEVDGGWSVAMTTLGFERGPASFGALCELAVDLEMLIEHARSHPGADGVRPLIADERIAERLGELRAQVQALRAVMYLMVGSAEADVDLGAEGSVLQLPMTEMVQTVSRFAMEILGPTGLSRRSAASWTGRYFDVFSATLAGGTSEIHRNILGERLLGLPR